MKKLSEVTLLKSKLPLDPDKNIRSAISKFNKSNRFDLKNSH